MNGTNVTVTTAGLEGAATATVVVNAPNDVNFDATLDKTSAISNGDVLKVTVTSKDATKFTVNGGASAIFDHTVTGLSSSRTGSTGPKRTVLK